MFPNLYKCLKSNSFRNGDYKIVPIRYEDRLDIMKWRNEQMYHLRQSEPLTEKSQEDYFKRTLTRLFYQRKPNQILFSYLKDDVCIGYGGLVHINWIDKNAEISFVMDTTLENEEFRIHWTNYLKLIEEIAFKELLFHKLFVYAFDLRPHLYNVLTDSNYFKDAVLREHCLFNDQYIDVVIHSKLKTQE